MTKAIGAYVRRQDRTPAQPGPDDRIPRCDGCGARLDTGMAPHFCKELTFQSMPLLTFEKFST